MKKAIIALFIANGVLFVVVFFTHLCAQSLKQCYRISSHGTILYMNCNCNCTTHQNKNNGKCLRCTHKVMINSYGKPLRELIVAEELQSLATSKTKQGTLQHAEMNLD